MAILIPYPKFYATDENGEPLVGGQLFTYEAGTTTKRDTYTDASGGVANTNPVILDSSGLANVWIDPAYFYKFVLSPSTDTDPPTDPIWTVDDIGVTTPEGLRGLTFVANTTSTSDTSPGSGRFKWNNATQSSATVLYFNNSTSDGASLTTFWASLPPGGFITLQQSDDSTAWQLWKWTAVPVDGTGYRKFTVSLQAYGGAITDEKLTLVSFVSRSANAALDALAGLTPAADKVPYFTSGTVAALADFPSVGRTLVGQTTQALARSTGLGLGTLTFPLLNYGGLNFNGTTTYLDTNPLTGVTDTKKGTLFCVVRFANAAGALETIIQATGSRLNVQRLTDGNLFIQARNSVPSTILSQPTTGEPLLAAGTYAIMASWDMAVPGSFRLRINDVTPSITSTTFTDDTIDYTTTEFSVGGSTGGTNFLSGDIYLLWFTELVALEFDTATIRRAFTDANNVTIYLGRNGELPTGTAPILFLGYDVAAQWPINRGSAQSTTFTQNGTIAAATTVIYGQWTTLYTIGTIKDVTADYTILPTDRTLRVNKGSLAVITLPAANTCKSRQLRFVTITANGVDSASSNVEPRAGGAAAATICGTSDGAWTDIESNGTSWIITASS